MEVILIKDMENLGYANDIVTVKPGYANNYLIPQGYAKAATASAKKVLAENLRQRAHKDAKTPQRRPMAGWNAGTAPPVISTLRTRTAKRSSPRRIQ